jgi:hypothetical protein
LDALDELWKPKWIDNLRIAIREFIDDYPRVKVIITSRPDALTPAWRNLGMVVSMADLRDDQVANFLASNLAEDDFSAAVRFRQDNDEIAALTRKPLYLAAFVKGIRPDFTEDAELHEPTVTAAEAPITLPPSLPAGSIGLAAFVQEHSPDFDAPGPEINLQQEQITDESPDLPDPTISRSSVLARMIERIWQHDQKHFREAKSTLSETEALDALMRLAAEVDGQNLFTYERARIRKRKYALNRFLSLGLLDQLPEGLTFPCRTLQYYMAAERLWRLWRLGKKRRFCKLVSSSDSFWRTVYEFFTEIAYEQLAEEHYKQCLASQG